MNKIDTFLSRIFFIPKYSPIWLTKFKAYTLKLFSNRNKSNIWFKTKIHGFGWFPVTIEGWFVILSWIIVVSIAPLIIGKLFTHWQTIYYFIFIPVSILALSYICYEKGERSQFKWKRKADTLEFIIKKFKLDLKSKSQIDIPDTDRETLARLFKELGFKKGVEIGVEEGFYSEVICKANPGVKLYCVDSWKAYSGYFEHKDQIKLDGLYEKAKNRLKNYNVEFIRKLSMDAVKDFEDNSLDFVYIDGNHQYQYVLDDVTEWAKKIRPGGIISGHDFRRDKSKLIQVVEAVSKYVGENKITLFVFGRKAPLSTNEKRDKHRSWMWIKSKPETDSMLGKWDKWYKNITKMGSFRYGDTITYKLAADFLADMSEVEDWGCGTGGFKRFYKGKYTGVDGSTNPFVDKVADLRTYRSSIDGIVMRHVLEHNYDWEEILGGAIESFKKKFCLILFTPFSEATQEIAHNRKYGVDVPDLAFARSDIENYLTGLKWKLESHKTKTGYGIEHIYYVER